MKRTTPILPVALMVAALLLSGSSARAQKTPKVFTACYVSSTGTIYLINEPGLKTQCQNSNHVQFSWIDGVPGYDHGFLNGLADDDHPQYLLADGTRALAGHLHAGGFKIAGLAAGTEAGDAVRYEQAVKGGDPAGGDLLGTYPNPSVGRLRGQAVSSTAPTSGQVLTFDGSAWVPVTPPAGITDHGLLSGLADDDHSQYLLADGVRASTNGFAVTGTYGTGSIPLSGAGTRLMWYPGKAALRAGEVTNQWDDAHIGPHSTAFGSYTTASGWDATAMGTFTIASGNQSIAVGANNIASGQASTALGINNAASGGASTALGVQTTASGSGSTSLGGGTTASGDYSTALGYFTTASGLRSVAMGAFASTNGFSGSMVYGDESTFGTRALVHSTAANQFVVRAAGGFRLFTSSNTEGFAFEGGSSTGCALVSSDLTCSGTIASASGGFRFPDGTVQTSANAGGVTDHGALSGLTDDDHPQYLLTDGVRSATSGFAVTGTLGTGAIPATGRGVRLMWYPRKAAFRAGEVVVGSEWDDANVGTHSIATGRFTTASGSSSTAMGSGTTASGNFSTALGLNTTASGAVSLAAGDASTASGLLSVAIGSASASGDRSTAIGSSVVASGAQSTAVGSTASTNGQVGSFVYGDASFPATFFLATAPNQFVVRAAGGFRFRTAPNLSTGCDIATGALTCTGTIASASGGFQFPDGSVQTTANAGGVTDHGTLTGLTDDDHPQYLLSDGVRTATNGFSVTGTLGNGTVGTSGAGPRLVWYPGKGAFRAGHVCCAQAASWDDANIGQHSIAMGLNTTASGTASTALGSHTSATGLDATAVGSFTTASGDRSTAMGFDALASGAASTALGRSTTASGDRSTAMGTNASTNGFAGAFAYGDESTFGTGALVQATAANQFVVRASGGFRFRTSSDLSTGCDVVVGALTCSGTIASTSGGFTFPDGSVQTTAATGGGTLADGSVTTTKLADGAVTRAKMAPDTPTPVAFAFVNGQTGCAVLAKSQNVTGCSKISTGTYEITIAGEFFSTTTHLAVVTAYNPGHTASFSESVTGGKLRVYVSLSTGGLVDEAFSFVVFKP